MNHLDFVVWVLGCLWFIPNTFIEGSEERTGIFRLFLIVIAIVVGCCLWFL
jgi:hypothetical protein